MKSKAKFSGILILGLVILYLLLLIPERPNSIATQAAESPFLWNRDAYWNQLEDNFLKAKELSPEDLQSKIQAFQTTGELLVKQLDGSERETGDSIFYLLQENVFNLAPLVAVHPMSNDWFLGHYNNIRNKVKHQSQYWNMNSQEARNTVYGMLYGMRAAVEEVLLQAENLDSLGTMIVNDISSPNPTVELLGINLQSGDLLLSRGGAEVSALISRGNDYPGNFSHVALIYVDEVNKKPYIIEAHIEKGVAITDLEGYMRDKKLRVMVLRASANLPALIKDPLLPHKAAKFMYDEALSRHIPYDFKMDFHDAQAMFCSEVGSYAYQTQGFELWQSVSTISSQGIVDWMHSFGVENFVTQMPSDLEYDPQLMVIGEWRDAETLFKDHLDNAVVDVLLEEANAGKSIEINPFQLPLVRLIKGYCSILNQFGKICMIPEGMSATTALRNNAFVVEFNNIKVRTEPLIEEFVEINGYRPPYWKLIEMAGSASRNNAN